MAAAVLGEPFVMGKSASRYRGRGRFRETDERELILCNLAVRRDAFLSLGGFDEDLFPNEENELLERLSRAGLPLAYHPAAVVERPPVHTFGELLSRAFRYGRGRSAQAKRSMSGVTAVRLGLAATALLLLLGVAGGLLGGTPFAVWGAAAAYGLYLAGVGVKLALRTGGAIGTLGAVAAAFVHAAYAAGILTGLFWPAPPGSSVVVVEKKDGRKGVPA